MTADDGSREDPPHRNQGESGSGVPEGSQEGGPGGSGAAGGSGETGLPFDEEAAWRLIVENYGERPVMGADGSATGLPDTTPPADRGPEAATPVADPVRPSGDPRPSPFDRSYLDALEAARAEQAAQVPPHDAAAASEEHFVPPEPPPVPRGTPARRLAWAGLFLPPLLMFAAVVFRLSYPSWFSLGLVAGFIGGFVFLVATMPRDGGDGWSDGAVV